LNRIFILIALVIASLIGLRLFLAQKKEYTNKNIAQNEFKPELADTTIEIEKAIPAIPSGDRFLTYTISPKENNVHLYWKDDSGKIIQTFDNLKKYISSKNEKLIFAMNAGMFQENYSPLGLYIEKARLINKLNMRNSSKGNFYMKPNGIFYITRENKAEIATSDQFQLNENIIYATQSGPMLMINGAIHSSFQPASTNLNIRNGVGVNAKGEIVFVLSKVPVNFYEFAQYFKEQGCDNALYLDGFVSKAYLPEQNWTSEDGNFGVMIGITEKN
jgi:uncharacterized protein YigE (DUF2233 family)